MIFLQCQWNSSLLKKEKKGQTDLLIQHLVLLLPSSESGKTIQENLSNIMGDVCILIMPIGQQCCYDGLVYSLTFRSLNFT